MKKKAIATVLTGVMAVSLAACGSSSSSSSSTGSTETTTEATTEAAAASTEAAGSDSNASGDSVKLTVYWWGNQVRNDRTNQVLEMYTEENPNVTFDGQFQDWADYWNKLATSAAGNALPDVMQMDYAYLDQYASKGQLLDLTPYIESGALDMSKVDQSILDSGSVDGKVYAISLGTNAPMLIYNKTAADAAGVTITNDMTMDEFVEASKTIQEKTGYATNFGYTTPSSSSSQLEYMLRADGKVLYEDGKLGVDSADEMYSYFELVDQGIKEGWQLDPGVFAETSVGSVEQNPLIYGSSPENMSWCTFSFSNQLSAFINAKPEDMELAACPWPSDDVAASNYLKPSQFFSISATTANPDEAVAFLNWFINDVDCNNVLLAERGVPINSDVAEAIKPNVDETTQYVMDYINDVVTPACTAINPPHPDGAAEAEQTLFDLQQNILYQQIEPDDAADQYFEQANSLLAQ